MAESGGKIAVTVALIGLAGALLAAYISSHSPTKNAQSSVAAPKLDEPPTTTHPIQAVGNSGQIASVSGSNNTTIQGSGNTITVAGGPGLGEDTYVITDKIANLPPDGIAHVFEGIDGPVTYCGDGSFTFRNLSAKTIVLDVCESETDNCQEIAGLAPGERRKLVARDFSEGTFDFFDSDKRFSVNLITKKQCSTK